jgi:hypothetical protein
MKVVVIGEASEESLPVLAAIGDSAVKHNGSCGYCYFGKCELGEMNFLLVTDATEKKAEKLVLEKAFAQRQVAVVYVGLKHGIATKLEEEALKTGAFSKGTLSLKPEGPLSLLGKGKVNEISLVRAAAFAEKICLVRPPRKEKEKQAIRGYKK